VDVRQFLLARGVSFDAVGAAAADRLGLVDGDVLFASGSLVEDLGNERSDLDFRLVTSRRDLQFSSHRDVLFQAGNVVCDVDVISWDDLDALLGLFQRWGSDGTNVRDTKMFSDDDLELLHYLRCGLVLHGEASFQSLRSRVAPASLARLKLDRARYYANTLQIDLAGMRAAGDWASAIFVAQDLLARTADALLAAHFFTNPSPKWRVKLLERLAATWEQGLPGRRTGLSPVDRYLSLHRAPMAATGDAVTEYALRIVAFSRVVFPWADACLRLGKRPALPGVGPDDTHDEALPNLDLDVVITHSNRGFELRRLGSSAERYPLSAQDYALLCLFDGETSRRRAAAQTAGIWGRSEGLARFDTLVRWVMQSGLTVRPLIDENRLRSLLKEKASSY
jgi:hypothetical protein